MKHKTIHETAKCKITKPLICPTSIVINKLMIQNWHKLPRPEIYEKYLVLKTQFNISV